MIKIELRPERHFPGFLLVGVFNLQGIELASVVVDYKTWGDEGALKKIIFEAVMLNDERGKSGV